MSVSEHRAISLSLRTRLTLASCALAAAGAAGAFAARALGHAFWTWILWALVIGALAAWMAARFTRPLTQTLRALAGTVTSFREGDFSMSLVADRHDEIGDLLSAHNELADALRAQRAHLVQRELLLDTVMQNSPMAMVLVDAHGRVAFANIAARQLLSGGRSLNELVFLDALSHAPAALRDAVSGEGDSLFSAEIEGTEEAFHLSQRAFILQGRSFRLFLIKRLTRELSRQEVSTWKKLIRVLSHELNNSLGPLSSLAHSGAEIARRGDHASLPTVFSAIAERAEHLHRFVGGYAAFAKLPAPRPEPIEWTAFMADLAQQHAFGLASPLPERPGWFDRVQMEQAVINLLKNAHEAGGADGTVELAISGGAGGQRLEVRDRGSGMSPAVLAQALLPFYSTKRSGTGIGLALAREIAEAHGGRIQLANREGGGLSVALELPWTADALEAEAPAAPGSAVQPRSPSSL